MSSETNQKTKLSNCNHEQLFKALARVEAKLATTTIKDKTRAPHAVKSITDMSEHSVATDIDDIPQTRLGNPKYRGWLPSEFGADKQYWEKKGVNPGKLLNDTFESAYRTSNWGPSDYVWSSSGYKVRRVPNHVPELYRVSSISPYGNSN